MKMNFNRNELGNKLFGIYCAGLIGIYALFGTYSFSKQSYYHLTADKETTVTLSEDGKKVNLTFYGFDEDKNGTLDDIRFFAYTKEGFRFDGVPKELSIIGEDLHKEVKLGSNKYDSMLQLFNQ